MRAIAEIAVNVPVLKLFHYRIPEALVGSVELGHRVLIPFGRRTTTGVCVRFPEESDVKTLKPIERVLHPECRFDAHLLELTQWIAEYYHAAWGEVLEAALPPPVRSRTEERLVRWISAARPSAAMLEEAKRLGAKASARSRLLVFLARNRGPHVRLELLQQAAASAEALRALLEKGWAVEERGRGPDRPVADQRLESLSGLSGAQAPELHPDQVKALENVQAALQARAFRAVLLHGITGSGKTEVYLRALRGVLAAGGRGLVLVPEISLTAQTVLRFREGLAGEPISVLHSKLTGSERGREWRRIQEGKARLVIGVRSSIFAPVPDLGLIVIDEEHDASYKQESTPRYHARDAAIVRARLLGIPILLGSATPSLESLSNARSGKYQLVEMPRRVTAHDLPVVTTVPLEPSFYRPDGSGLITEDLDRLIRGRLARKEQVLLFLNRRGFSTYLHCVRCGFVLKCPECDITLTFHKSQDSLRCHYCGHARTVPRDCPDCDMPSIRRSGVGTEKISAEIDRRFDGARVGRLDRDTATSHRAIEGVIARFARGELDILVGTQMVAKGHDFPGVTLVGIVNADTGLHFPDFRAAERTFQVLTQVAGRAGRGLQAGRVVIQTFFPDHFAIRCAATNEFDEFARIELESRRALGYPPFGRLVKVLLQGPDPEDVSKQVESDAEVLREGRERCQVLGPAPSPIAKIQGKFRYQILLKSSSSRTLHAALERLEAKRPVPRSSVERIIDVDPQSML